MATTFDVIYLGLHDLIDIAEDDTIAENASVLNGLTFGSEIAPLAGAIYTMSPVSGTGDGVYNTDNDDFTDQFAIAGLGTFTYDALGLYNATIAYVGGGTATISAVVFQDTTGRTFLAPEMTANADQAALEAGAIQSLTLDSLISGNSNLSADRQSITYDDGGIVRGTAGGESMSPGYTDADGDQIDGADGDDDRINAGGGDDTVDAGAGDDTVAGGTGADSLTGGSGTDILDYSSNSGAVALDLGASTVTGAEATGDTISGFEGAIGSGFADTMTAGASGSALWGLGGADTLNGGAGNDTLDGGAGNDEIYSNGGDDVLYGRDGADRLDTGAGSDTAYGGDGNDTIIGGIDGDLIFGEGNNDRIEGKGGSDTISGGDGDDLIVGYNAVGITGGNTAVGSDDGAADSLSGDAGSDTILGGGGNDTISGGAGADSLTGGTGTDILDYSGSGAAIDLDLGASTVTGGEATGDTISGFEGVIGSGFADTVTGSSGADRVFSGAGDDLIVTGDGNDSIEVGAGSDTALGGAGDDTLIGGDGGDDLQGGDGNDRIEGRAGDDTILGGAGDDLIVGYDAVAINSGNTAVSVDGGGADVLEGGSGNDTILGGAGDDTIGGGTGDDSLTGGTGDDVFTYGAGDGHDTIADFNVGNSGLLGDGDTTNNDFIDLSAFYDSLSELREDFRDDGVLNQSNDTASGGTADYADNAQFGAGSLTFQGASAQDFRTDNTGVSAVCFARGTLIRTDRGAVPVETLSRGDKVMTLCGGVRAIRWVGGRRFGAQAFAANPRLRPIRVLAGALGMGLPRRDLVVSPQHRLLVRSKVAMRMFGVAEVLVAAKELLMLEGVCVAHDMEEVEYWHFLLDRHRIVFAEDMPSESLYGGPEALKVVPPEAVAEIRALLTGEVAPPPPARRIVAGRRARKLVTRHKRRAARALGAS